MAGDRRTHARELLVEIRAELKAQALWEPAPPPPDALKSEAPFCFDTLEFNQWLQWVFIPRTHALLDAGGSFPADSNIAPMAEWFDEQNEDIDGRRLTALLARFDRLWEGD